MELTPTWLIPFFKILFRSSAQLINFFSYYFTQTSLTLISAKNTEPVNNDYSHCVPENHNIEQKVCSAAELNVVMDKLGLMTWDHPSDSSANYVVGAKDICAVFELEPSLEEVREAFDVFDQNRDGFIDETELHRVLCCLGLSEISSGVDACKRMISAFDANGDGVIDFGEFVKFMENCFC